MGHLRDIGNTARDNLRSCLNKGTSSRNQFVITMMASSKEIKTEDYLEIRRFKDNFEGLYITENLRVGQRFAQRGRVCVLLNAPWNMAHGEARLLDPMGKILFTFVDERLLQNCCNACNRYEYKPYLCTMSEDFCSNFPDEISILLIFSFYIPCTLPAYMCSNLISEFALKNKGIVIIVAYENVFWKTNKNLAVAFMNQLNIYLLHIPRYSKKELGVNSDKLSWRTFCNKKWKPKSARFYPLSDGNGNTKRCRRVNTNKIEISINKITTHWIPVDMKDIFEEGDDDNYSYIDNWFEDKMSAVDEYYRCLRVNKRNSKSRSKGRSKQKIKSQRKWSNVHEVFWSMY